MKTSDILSADLLDVLFDGKNKSYGAYDLRKTYHRRINLALAVTSMVCLLFVASSLLASSKKSSIHIDEGPEVMLKKIEDKIVEPPPPPPPPKPPVPQVEIARFTPFVITRDEDVKPEDQVKDIDELENVKIGTINRDGVKDDDMIAPPVERVGDNTAKPKVDEDIDKIFIDVQQPAEFATGMDGWRRFLERNLNNELPVDNGAPPGKYTVVVSFVVDRSGAISDVKAENDPGYGTRAEAIRVIQKGPKWIPAKQNGHAVIYRHRQSITFTVSE